MQCVPLKLQIHICSWTHKGAKIQSLNMCLLEASSQRNQRFGENENVFFYSNTSNSAQCDLFNVALLQGTCSQETLSGFVG